MDIKKPNIFNYLDYRKFLNDIYYGNKKKGHDFSFGRLADLCEFKSRSYFRLIMNGERNLAIEGARKIANGLQLKTSENEYFINLVLFNQAKNNKDKNHYFEIVRKIQFKNGIKTLDHSEYDYYSNWYNLVIREIVTLDDFKEDVEWIANKLSPGISKNEVKKSLELLIKLKLLVRNKAQKLEQSTPHLISESGVSSLAILNYHRKMIELARESLDRHSKEKRSVSSITLSANEKLINKLKTMMGDFKKEVIKLVDKETNFDRVMQLNLHLFPLTTP